MNNRIDPTPVVLTLPRQTPKRDFGEVLSRTVNGVVRLGGAIFNNAVGGMPVVSAAISAINNLASATGRSASNVAQPAIPVASVPGGGGVSASSGGLSGSAPGVGADQYGGSMVEQMHASSMQSLYLQVAMQQESREYNAVSNVLKVRHDSAKAAINNIR